MDKAILDVFAGDTTGALKAATLYIYGTNTHQWAAMANARGELQGVRRYAGPNQYVDTRYTYRCDCMSSREV